MDFSLSMFPTPSPVLRHLMDARHSARGQVETRPAEGAIDVPSFQKFVRSLLVYLLPPFRSVRYKRNFLSLAMTDRLLANLIASYSPAPISETIRPYNEIQTNRPDPLHGYMALHRKSRGLMGCENDLYIAQCPRCLEHRCLHLQRQRLALTNI